LSVQEFDVGSSAVVQWRQGFVVLNDGDLIVHIASYTDVDEARATAEQLAGNAGRRWSRHC
jgi:dTDP-4-dehydrorhamnose reductase